MTKQNLLLSALVATFMSASVPATAAAPGADANAPSAAQQAQQAKIQALAQEYREITTELGKIRDATYKAHPDLVKQRDAFEKQVEQRMAKNGYDPEPHIKEMQGIAEQLKSEDLDQDKKQDLVKDFQQKRQALTSAQEEALSAPKVKKAGEKLQKDTLEAMKAQDKETDKLLDRLADLRENLQKISDDS